MAVCFRASHACSLLVPRNKEREEGQTKAAWSNTVNAKLDREEHDSEVVMLLFLTMLSLKACGSMGSADTSAQTTNYNDP